MNLRDLIQRAARWEHERSRDVVTQEDDRAVRALTPLAKLADEPPLMLLSGATIATGVVLRRPIVWRNGVRMLASHLVANALKTILKASVDRRRPKVAVEEGDRPAVSPGTGTDDKAENAFPSGHTAGAVAVAQAVAHEAPALAMPARGVAMVAGGMQVPRGAHYVSDVLVGAAVGWLSERIASGALRRVEVLVRRRLHAR